MVRTIFYQKGTKRDIREMFYQTIEPYIIKEVKNKIVKEVEMISPKETKYTTQCILDLSKEKLIELLKDKPFWFLINKNNFDVYVFINKEKQKELTKKKS